MLFVVSFISIRHFLVYISVCILYIVGSMFAIILCQIVTLPCGTVVSTDITNGSITDSSVLKAQVPSAVVGNVVSTIYFGGIQSLDWTGLDWTGTVDWSN